MQIVYRATCLDDARSACHALERIGISTHIADQELWGIAGQGSRADVIRVFVDNRRLDEARRVIRIWREARDGLTGSAEQVRPAVGVVAPTRPRAAPG